jgi:hypothetical protein
VLNQNRGLNPENARAEMNLGQSRRQLSGSGSPPLKGKSFTTGVNVADRMPTKGRPFGGVQEEAVCGDRPPMGSRRADCWLRAASFPRGLIAWFLGLFFSFSQTALAQAPAGGLRGQIIDADFSQPIPNVTVRLGDTGRAVVTDNNGNFFFNEVPPGSYTVSATREGYRLKESRDASVSPGAVSEVRLELTGEVEELEDFVVSAEDLISSDAAKTLDIRANLSGFGEALGADFISKVGGSDVGDVVKRIVGTSVADSRYVVIRGLSDRYNTVLLNGLRIPSSDPDRRAVNIDIFPSSIVGQLTNTKTFSPDLVGESTGGSINIITKTSPLKPFVNFSLGLGYNNQSTGDPRYVTYRGGGTGVFGTLRERRMPAILRGSTKGDLPILPTAEQKPRTIEAARSLNPTIGVTTKSPPEDISFNFSAGTHIDDFMGGPLGLLAAFTYAKKYEFDAPIIRDSLIIVGNGARVLNKQFLTEEGSETLLTGLLLAAGWQPTENDTIKATLFANLAAEDRASFQQGLIQGSGTPNPGDDRIADVERIAVRETLQYTERRLRTLQFTGEHQFPALQDSSMKWGVAYSLSSQDEPDGRYVGSEFDRPTRTFSPLGGFAAPVVQRYWRELDDTNYNVTLDFKIPLAKNSSGEQSAFLKLGANFEHSERDYRADTFGYPNLPDYQLKGLLSPDDRKGTTIGDEVGYFPDVGIGRLTLPEIYEASQTIAAAYAMTEFDLTRNFRVSMGLRVESTDIRSQRDSTGITFSQNGVPDGGQGVPTTDPVNGGFLPRDKFFNSTIAETNVLPSLALSWAFAENMKLKFAASRTVARPSFKEVAPVISQDPVTLNFFRGNQLLETSTIDNVDLRWEWLPAPSDIVAVSFFTKFIDRPIELFTSPSGDFFANQESAVLYGYEFEIQKGLGFLADDLRDFSIGLNATRLYSQVDVADAAARQRIGSGLNEVRRLQGQPDYLLNFNVSYDGKDSGLFMGLFLNVTGETLYQAGSQDAEIGFTADIFQQPITSLDFAMSKKFANHYKLTFRAENLINAEVERVAEGRTVYAKSSGTKFSLSFSGSW